MENEKLKMNAGSEVIDARHWKLFDPQADQGLLLVDLFLWIVGFEVSRLGLGVSGSGFPGFRASRVWIVERLEFRALRA